MLISDWSSDVCSSDLSGLYPPVAPELQTRLQGQGILLAQRLRDLACRGRHAADALAVDVGAARREHAAQRAADGHSGVAPHLSHLRRRDARRSLSELAQAPGIWSSRRGPSRRTGAPARTRRADEQARTDKQTSELPSRTR